jgi:spore germination protein
LREGGSLKGVVTSRQIFFILFLTLTGYTIINIPKTAMESSGTGAWITIIITSIIFSVGVYFISSLNKKFIGKTLYEYTILLLGKPVAYIICIIYTIYFFLVFTVLLKSVGYFIKSSFLPMTPIWIMILLIISIPIFAAYKGLTVVARMSEFYGLFFIITALALHFAMFLLGDIREIQPLFDREQIDEYIFGIKGLIIPFLGIEILSVIPFGENNKKRGVLFSVSSVLFVGFFYIISALTSTMMLGQNEVTSYRDSTVGALRITEIPETTLLERPDFIYLTIGIAGILTSLSIEFITVVENTAKLISKANKNVLLIIIGIITYIISVFVIDSDMANFLLETVILYYGLATAFLIPIILFIISKFKKNK